jgi:hypothetical protein
MLLLIFTIMIFKGVLADSRAALQIRRSDLLDYRIPVFLVILILPFLSGLITGLALAYVGISFPLIIPLFQGGPPSLARLYGRGPHLRIYRHDAVTRPPMSSGYQGLF